MTMLGALPASDSPTPEQFVSLFCISIFSLYDIESNNMLAKMLCFYNTRSSKQNTRQGIFYERISALPFKPIVLSVPTVYHYSQVFHLCRHSGAHFYYARSFSETTERIFYERISTIAVLCFLLFSYNKYIQMFVRKCLRLETLEWSEYARAHAHARVYFAYTT